MGFRTITTIHDVCIHSRQASSAGVESSFGPIGSGASKDTTEGLFASFGALKHHCLAHDGTSTAKDLQVGHAAASDGCMTSRCRQRAQGGR